MDFELDDEQLELQRRRPRPGRQASARRRWCAPSSTADDDGDGLWKTLVEARLAGPDRARRRRRHRGLRGRAGDRPRGAGPGRRPHAVPGHDQPVRAAGAGVRRPRPAPRAARRGVRGRHGHGRLRGRRRAARRGDGDGWVLDGTARHVVDGDRADEVAVVAAHRRRRRRLRRAAGDRRGDPDARRSTASFHLADVALDGVRGRRRAGAAIGPEVGRRDRGARGTRPSPGWPRPWSAPRQRVLELVLDHIKDRQQFGVPIVRPALTEALRALPGQVCASQVASLLL